MVEFKKKNRFYILIKSINNIQIHLDILLYNYWMNNNNVQSIIKNL